MEEQIVIGAPVAPEAKPAEWTMPSVYVGDIVLWSYNSDGEKSPAVVTKVGDRAIAVNVFIDSYRDLILKTGCRHKEDPFLSKFPQHEGGCWDYTKRMKQIKALLDNFAEE